MDKEEKKLLRQQVWYPILFSMIIGVACMYAGYKVLETKVEAHEPRVCKLEADTKCLPLLNYKLDLILQHFNIKVEPKNGKE